MLKYYLFASLLFMSFACKNKRPYDEKASKIIEQCIEVYGGKNYRHLNVSFDYRKFRMHLKQDGGNFLYERTTKDSLNNEIHDVLTNEGFTRKINGTKQDLTVKDSLKYKDGLNAIAYFVLLPYKLSEPAVNLKYTGEATIENNTYHKIDVTFEKEAGGKDHEDEFCYWINQKTHSMDYFSYSNGGARFRKAIKRQREDGVVFQDYNNYEILDTSLSASDYDKAFIAGKFKILSTIEQDHYTLDDVINK